MRRRLVALQLQPGEFILILPGTSAEEALAMLARVRERLGLELRDVTISAGIATTATGAAALELVARADTALYRCKRKGGNRIALYGEDAEY